VGIQFRSEGTLVTDLEVMDKRAVKRVDGREVAWAALAAFIRWPGPAARRRSYRVAPVVSFIFCSVRFSRLPAALVLPAIAVSVRIAGAAGRRAARLTVGACEVCSSGQTK
jgi:hypothetical protein